jgi:AraC-like DNA-binding protein
MVAPRTSAILQIFNREDVPLHGIIMFGRYQNAASQTGLLPHSHHNAIEICFLERGEQSYRVHGLVHRLHGNDQFFTLPGEVHDSASLPQERGILYWLILSLEAGTPLLGLSSAAARELRRELRRMPVRHFRAHADCSRILGEIISLIEPGRRGRPELSGPRHLRLLALFLEYLTLTIEAAHQGSHNSATPLMQRVLRYIESHLGDPVHVPDLAQVARLSESRFKARFKRELGVPPAEFWLRKKIEKAVLLLRDQDVTAVAYELGFSSSQYFATVFKRYTLLKPSKFRLPARPGKKTKSNPGNSGTASGYRA